MRGESFNKILGYISRFLAGYEDTISVRVRVFHEGRRCIFLLEMHVNQP